MVSFKVKKYYYLDDFFLMRKLDWFLVLRLVYGILGFEELGNFNLRDSIIFVMVSFCVLFLRFVL